MLLQKKLSQLYKTENNKSKKPLINFLSRQTKRKKRQILYTFESA